MASPIEEVGDLAGYDAGASTVALFSIAISAKRLADIFDQFLIVTEDGREVRVGELNVNSRNAS